MGSVINNSQDPAHKQINTAIIKSHVPLIFSLENSLPLNSWLDISDTTKLATGFIRFRQALYRERCALQGSVTILQREGK